MSLHPDKTRLIECGRHAAANARRRGERKPATFDFLGLTQLGARSRRGSFTLHVRTMRKRLRRSLQGSADGCQRHRHDPVAEQGEALNAKLRGHYPYYGRPTNYRSLWQFHRGVRRLWKKWLNRRTRGKTHNWAAYAQLLERHPLRDGTALDLPQSTDPHASPRRGQHRASAIPMRRNDVTVADPMLSAAHHLLGAMG